MKSKIIQRFPFLRPEITGVYTIKEKKRKSRKGIWFKIKRYFVKEKLRKLRTFTFFITEEMVHVGIFVEVIIELEKKFNFIGSKPLNNS